MGKIKVPRTYFVCVACRDSHFPLDHRLGLTGYLTVGARRLLSLAGASWSFDQARDKLHEFCGLEASDELIRRTAQATGVAIADWMAAAPEAVAEFQTANGEAEFETDGVKVNTTEGWRDVKIALFAKRLRGESASTDQWDKRVLPAPMARFATARIAESTAFAVDWRPTAVRLGIDPDAAELTVLADGAEWIWNRAGEQFPAAAGVLDIYHAIEHVAAAARKCFGDNSPRTTAAIDRGRSLLLADGYLGVVNWLGELTAAAEPGFDGAAFGELLNYLAAHQTRLNYALRLYRGQSIGSGQIEGAAKSMVGRRLKINSCRWREANVNKMCGLAAAFYSNCWAEYWNAA